MHGRGKETFASGDSIDGNYVNNQLHGHVIYNYADGSNFECEYVNGKRVNL